MTTPQPQPVTRYRVHVGEYAEDSDGEFIRIDDPALVAAREAMAKAIKALSRRTDASLDRAEEELRLALAGLTPKEDAR